MNSLLFEINKQADKTLTENKIISDNIDLLLEYLSMEPEQLNEAISTWLAKVRNTVSSGKMDPEKKNSVVKILGALSAISNPDLADALDEKGDLGTILFNAGGKDKMKSNLGLQSLLMLGNHPSVKAFVNDASRAIDDSQIMDSLTKQIQSKIEPIMNKKLGMERRDSNF